MNTSKPCGPSRSSRIVADRRGEGEAGLLDGVGLDMGRRETVGTMQPGRIGVARMRGKRHLHRIAEHVGRDAIDV